MSGVGTCGRTWSACDCTTRSTTERRSSSPGLVFPNVSEDDQALEFVVDDAPAEGTLAAERLTDDGAWAAAGEITPGEPAALTVAAGDFAVLWLSAQ